MQSDDLAEQLRAAKEYFDRSTRCLTEEDSTFSPTEESRTTAQQVAHVAQTVEWFFEGAFRPEGFSLDFESLEEDVEDIESLSTAREWLDRAFAVAEERTRSVDSDEWDAALPEGPVMGGAPRHAIVPAIVEHTAHHRGALTVYSRLLGYTPPMPYMETEAEE